MIERTCSRCFSNSHRDPHPSYPSPRAPQSPKRFLRIRHAGIAAACLCLLPLHASGQNIEYRTLPELIESGNQALLRGDYPRAAQAFNSIRENYSEEPAWLEGQLPAKILPLAGFASHKANLQSEAIAALEAYLADFSGEQDPEIFARYTLAASLMLDGKEPAARDAFSALRQIAGNTAFRDLAILREAQLSEPQTAIDLLTQLIADPASARLAAFARLQLIQLHLEQDDPKNAGSLLLETQWDLAALPELTTLSLLATRVADSILAERPADALRAYQLVQSKSQLVDAQQTRIDTMKRTYQQRAPILKTEQSMWSEQFRQSIASLENQLSLLEAAPDYRDAIALRKARCFALVNRPIEAWILLQPIATSTNEHAREAHLEWISAARQMQAWNASSTIARNFLARYPDDKDIPQVLFWIALSQIEQEDFPEAIESLATILTKKPSHALASASRYYLGYSHFRLGAVPDAIAAYQDCIAVDPSKPIAVQAHLWIGICQFSTNKLEEAIATFRTIQETPASAFLHPEAAFRETACHYALGDLGTALPQIESWLANYAGHPREAEARLLYGDLLAESQNIAAAIEAYASVETDDPQLAYLALQKACMLLIDTKAPQLALEQLEAYRDHAPVPPRFIGSFTQLLATCLEPPLAQKEIAHAIQAYGQNLQASGIVELIHLLAETPEADQENPTLSSRIAVAEIQTHRQRQEIAQAKLKALELASRYRPEDLPPEALIAAGDALAEIGSLDAPLYFHSILEEYPESDYCDESYISLARYHQGRDEPEVALSYLLRSSFDTPETTELKLTLELELKRADQAQQSAETLLADRKSTPHQKAQALAALGHINLENGDPHKAYAYYQRIFTLYRGELEHVAQAYLACIRILSSEERYEDAKQVAEEFLSQTDLARQAAYAEAQKWIQPAPEPIQSRDLAPSL